MGCRITTHKCLAVVWGVSKVIKSYSIFLTAPAETINHWPVVLAGVEDGLDWFVDKDFGPQNPKSLSFQTYLDK